MKVKWSKTCLFLVINWSILTQYSTWMTNSPCCLHSGNRSDRKDMYLSRGHFLVLQGDESLLFHCNYHKALCLLSCKSRLRFILVWAEGVANANVYNSFTWSCRTRLVKRRVTNSEESAISGGESDRLLTFYFFTTFSLGLPNLHSIV